jgi:hypothetical protein
MTPRPDEPRSATWKETLDELAADGLRVHPQGEVAAITACAEFEGLLRRRQKAGEGDVGRS